MPHEVVDIIIVAVVVDVRTQIPDWHDPEIEEIEHEVPLATLLKAVHNPLEQDPIWHPP